MDENERTDDKPDKDAGKGKDIGKDIVQFGAVNYSMRDLFAQTGAGGDDFMRNIERGMLSFVNDNLLDLLHESVAPFENMMMCYRCALMEIETKFKVLNEQFSERHKRNPIESIKTRLKSQESILKKLQRRDFPVSLQSIQDNVTDVAGIRVICSYVDDIYFMADCLLQQDDIRLIERKDYIAAPKPNGYRSLHLIVEVPVCLKDEKKLIKTEVQFRTIAMDFWASLEHSLRYKKDAKIKPELRKQIEAELYSCAEASASLDERMKQLREMIYSKPS